MNIAAPISRRKAQEHSVDSHARWGALYRQQMGVLEGRLCPEFVGGLKALDITDKRIPSFEQINATLKQATGWEIFPVSRNISGEEEFSYLAKRVFPACSTIRSAEHMEFAPLPDIFHDIFGHVPMLMDPSFASFLQTFGKAGIKASRPERTSALLNLYFATAESGLIRTSDGFAIYGAACASSKSEAIHCLSDHVERVPIDIKAAMATVVDDTQLQKRYYVIDSFAQLYRLFSREMRV